MGEINRTSKPGLSYAVLGLRYHLVILSERLYALDMGDMTIASFSGPTFISSSRGKQKQNNNRMLLYQLCLFQLFYQLLFLISLSCRANSCPGFWQGLNITFKYFFQRLKEKQKALFIKIILTGIYFLKKSTNCNVCN